MPYDRKIREFGDLMTIPHSIEAGALDDLATVNAVLEAAWSGTREQRESGDARRRVASIWADLSLEPSA